MRELSNINEVLSINPDYLGFIFYKKSQRFVDDLNIDQIDFGKTSKIGVFVNASGDFIKRRVHKYKLDGIQLHGDETVEQVHNLRTLLPSIKIWKALRISDSSSLEGIQFFEKVCDLLILDSAGPAYGGNGTSWDHNLLDKVKLSIPFLLSGGIDASFDLSQLERIHPQCIGVDLNSKFEDTPGIKNFELLKTFFDANRI